MSILKKYQNAVIVFVVIIIAFVVYSFFFAGKATPILSEQTVGQANPADQDLISLLIELKGITLDESIFANAAFTSLQDFSKDLVPEAVGRTNPFAPLGATPAPAKTQGQAPAQTPVK